MIRYFAALFISFFSTFFLVPLVQKVALKLGALDIPNGTIKQHKKPTPYLGGVAVYLGFIASLALVFPYNNSLFFFFLGATIFLFVGLIDDILIFSPLHKFIGQCIATFCYLKAGFHLKTEFFSNVWNIFFSAVWILSVVNSFNLIDIMDGLATTVALCATGWFLFIALIFHLYTTALLLCCFLGSLLAFLWYNRPVAHIYLGDSGAHFLGAILATTPFLYNWGFYSPQGYFVPIFILAVPLLELFFLVVVRTIKGIPFYHASPDHFALRLKKRQFSIYQILFFTSFFSLISGFLGFFVSLNYFSLYSIFAVIIAGITIWSLCIFYR